MRFIEIPDFQEFDVKTTVGQKVWKDFKDNRFRIVKYSEIGNTPWYLLKQTSWMYNWLRQWRWETCTPYDYGLDDELNHMALNSGNPGILLTFIPKIIRHELTGTTVKNNGRDALPSFPIEKEVSMWASLIELSGAVFNEDESGIQQVNEKLIYKLP